MKAGWETQLLQEVAIFQRGTSITKKQVTSGNIPVIAGGQKPAYYHNQKNREANSITISQSGYAGFVSFHPYPIFASDCFTVEAKPDSLNQNFLFYLLKSRQEEIYGMQSGSTLTHIYPRDFSNFEIAFPPLEEQQRIVEILDESFAELETARSNVAANLESSKELFQSVLDESLNGAEEKGWEACSLGDVAKIVNGGTPKSNVSEFWQGDIQWLTPKDMGKMDGDFVDETPRTITEEGLNRSSAKLVPPNSVIMSTRAPIGHLAINTVAMAFNQGCRGMIPRKSLDTRYLFHFLNLKRKDLENLGTGTTFKELSGTALKAFEIPLPPLEEQQNIVEKLDSLGEQTDRLQQEYTAQLTDFDDLRQSLLQKAFAGELT